MNFDWLQDKRLRLVATTLLTILGAIVLFASLFSLFGYIITALITIIGALAIWIVVNEAVEKASPQQTSTPEDGKARPTVSLRIVCDPGPYKVDGGDDKIIKLKVKKGDVIQGHIRELDTTSFDWYIADEQSMIFYKRREWRKFKRLGEGQDEPAYPVSLIIPSPARWFLILDNHGKSNYRTILVDFEPIP